MSKKRKSNIELLRIISMMLVLLCHYVPTRENGMHNGVNALNENLLGTIINLELRSLSIVCTHCFILISGYNPRTSSLSKNFKVNIRSSLILIIISIYYSTPIGFIVQLFLTAFYDFTMFTSLISTKYLCVVFDFRDLMHYT